MPPGVSVISHWGGSSSGGKSRSGNRKVAGSIPGLEVCLSKAPPAPDVLVVTLHG